MLTKSMFSQCRHTLGQTGNILNFPFSNHRIFIKDKCLFLLDDLRILCIYIYPSLSLNFHYFANTKRLIGRSLDSAKRGMRKGAEKGPSKTSESQVFHYREKTTCIEACFSSRHRKFLSVLRKLYH